MLRQFSNNPECDQRTSGQAAEARWVCWTKGRFTSREDTTGWSKIPPHYSEQHTKLSISGIFHLIFSARNWLQVTETVQSKTANKVGGGYCMFKIFHILNDIFQRNNIRRMCRRVNCQRLALAWRKHLSSNKPKYPKSKTWQLLYLVQQTSVESLQFAWHCPRCYRR